MTSFSSTGGSNITIQFDLDRSVDSAARDVQAAINAARGQLPANMPNNPTYRKQNPADNAILTLALTSDVEERMMIDKFGQEYVAYASRTKRLIPYIF